MIADVEADVEAEVERDDWTWEDAPPELRKVILEKQRDINTDDNYWSEYTVEDATKMLGFLGYNDVKVYYSGFWCQGDGAQFIGKWDPAACEPLKVKAEVGPECKWQAFAERFTVLLVTAKFTGFPLPTIRITASGHYSHEYCTEFEFEEFDDWDNPAAADDHNRVQNALLELSRDMMKHIYRSLEKEYDYQSSEEAIVETIEGNDYHFDNEGAII